MTFGTAIEKLRAGERVARFIWNDEKYVQLKSPMGTWMDTMNDYECEAFLSPYGWLAIVKKGKEPFPWIPTCSDIFAHDWVEYAT